MQSKADEGLLIMQETVEVLEMERDWLHVMPDHEMLPCFKKLRQSLFKSEYKRRHAVQSAHLKGEAEEESDHCSSCDYKTDPE